MTVLRIKEQLLTNKQYKILTVLCHGNGKDKDGNHIPCDLDELLERVAYKTTKDSMQFSIRALVKRGLITKGKEYRRGANRVVYIPSRLAMQTMGYGDPSWIQDMDFEDIDL